MVVVGEITAPLEIDRAEELVIKLGAPISTRRIYAPGHGRAVRTMAVFQDALRSFPFKESEEHFEFTVANGMLLHRGIPLGMDHGALGQVAAALEARKCRGVRLHQDAPTKSVQALVDWLSERLIRPLTNPPEGVALLAEGGADQYVEGDDGGVMGIPDFKLPNDIHRTSARVLERVMEEARSRNQIDFKEIIELTNWVADAAFVHGTQLVSPTQTRCQDHYTFSHSVNVFLIATALLEPFARDREELASFAQAALLHDVGKSRIPYEILHKRGTLTDEEFRIMRTHPVHGAEILQQSDAADPLAIEVAYCHHMRDDDLGYPVPGLPIEPGPITAVVQISDMFEALTAHRPYKPGRSAWNAIQTILDTPGIDSKRPAIALLIERLTQSPPGSEVTLESGERAIVVKTFPEEPRRPLVRVIEDADGRPLTDPFDLDLREDLESPQPIVEVLLKPNLARMQLPAEDD